VLQSGDLACAHTAIIAEPVNIDSIVGRIRIYLEANRLAIVDAYIGREPLDVGATRTVDAPLALRISLLLIFLHDDIAGGRRRKALGHRPLRARWPGHRTGKVAAAAF
jgi:hypothetical protein